MLSYTKLWALLDVRGMKKTDLKQVISSATLAKLGKNETVSSTVIDKICEFLKCQPGDIMEYISKETITKFTSQFDAYNKAMVESMKNAGVSKEQFVRMFVQMAPMIAESIYEQNNTLSNLYDEAAELIEKNN